MLVLFLLKFYYLKNMFLLVEICLSRNSMNEKNSLKFSDGDGPNLCRVKK